MNKYLRQLFTAVVALFVILGLSSTIIMAVRANALNNDPRNARSLYHQLGAYRGAILASDGTVMAKSEPVNDAFKYLRTYSNGPLYAPVTGFFSINQTADRGLEASRSMLLNGEAAHELVGGLEVLVLGGRAGGADHADLVRGDEVCEDLVERGAQLGRVLAQDLAQKAQKQLEVVAKALRELHVGERLRRLRLCGGALVVSLGDGVSFCQGCLLGLSVQNASAPAGARRGQPLYDSSSEAVDGDCNERVTQRCHACKGQLAERYSCSHERRSSAGRGSSSPCSWPCSRSRS